MTAHVCEDVGLVANYRSGSRFHMPTGGGPEKLLAALQERNAGARPLKAPGPNARAGVQ